MAFLQHDHLTCVQSGPIHCPMSEKTPGRTSGQKTPIPSSELPSAVEGFSKLAASLNRVLDSSLRDVVCTLRDIDNARADGRQDLLNVLSEKLESSSSNLQEVSELVHTAMQGSSVPIGSSMSTLRRPVDVSEAVHHACDVVKMHTPELAIQFSVELSSNVGVIPSGSLYAAILAGLRHSAHSIENAGGSGTIKISVRLKTLALPTHNYEAVELVIEDDGNGPVDDDGVSGSISLCKAIVNDAGGAMELKTNGGRAPRVGSSLKMNVPKPIDWGSVTLGKKSA